ncbi:MAG: hypothetical protein RL758_64 [Pseudomonadota bacterium]|jgi:hypothetical protein
MANIFLAWQNRTDEGILSGGSWTAALPLTNLQNRQVQKVGRTSNATTAATQFQIDLQSPKIVGVLALIVHNLSVDAKVKISTAGSVAAYTNLFTTFQNDFTNAAWTKDNCSVTGDITLAPDGTLTADGVLAFSMDGGFVTRDVALAGTSTVTNAVYMKTGSTGAGALKITWMTGGTTQTASCDFDATTGMVSNIAGTASSITAYATDGGDGWWRVVLTGTGTSAGNTVVRYSFGNRQSGRTLFVWGAFVSGTEPPSYESPYIDAWPDGIIPQDLLEWEDDNFWLGTLTQEQRAGYQSPFIHRITNTVTARYVRVEIFDTTNPAGYVQIGRLFIARGWSPSINYTYGAALGYQDPTPVEMSLSGAEYFDIRSKFRVFNFDLEYISDSEAYSYALDLQRVAGISGEVLVMPDGGQDVGQQPLRSFVGRLRQIGPVTQPKPTAYSVKFEVKELL